MDVVYYVYFYISGPVVIRKIEVVAHRVLSVFGIDVIKVALESVHESSFCLSNILDQTCFACDAVYEVTALAIHP